MTRRARGGSETAAELMAELEADPEYVAAKHRQGIEVAQKAAARRAAEAPLVRDLQGAGFEVESAWDLVNTSTPYPEALPILVAHLGRPYPDRVREGIARALAVPDSRFAWDALVGTYRAEPAGTDAKDGLAVALAAVADDGVIDDVIAFANDPAHGASRILLLSRLKRSRLPAAREVLERSTEDPVLGREAAALLRGR